MGALTMVACGSAKTCRTPEAPLSYKADIQGFTATKCLNCHSKNVKGADRHGADPTLNYDTFAQMSKDSDTKASKVDKGEMPPKNMGVEDLTADEKDKFLQWVYCGALE